ncbi:DUF1634 domain-containing protein [bacterium]|nr:DUF1634 domain-containing protein [bacterium]
MTESKNVSLAATPEQVLYAKFLNKGMLVGLLILFITFAIYVFGLIDPYIAVGKISEYWALDVTTYLERANIPDGWGWVAMVNYADFLNFVGIAILAGITILCYAAIIPTLLKNNDKLYALLATLEVIVLAGAASGLLSVGH